MAEYKRTVAIGVDDFFAAKMTTEDAAGQLPEYDKPLHFPGVRKFGVTMQNSSTPWYDDNQKFAVFIASDGGTIAIEKSMLSTAEFAYLTDQQLNTHGEIEDNLQKNIPYFAIMYRRMLDGVAADGRQRYTYVTLYKVRMTRPDEGTSTKENQVTPQPDTIAGTAMPLESMPGVWRKFGENTHEGFTKEYEKKYFDAIRLPGYEESPEEPPAG